MKIELTNIKNLGTVWLWLGIAVLLLDFVAVGVSRWEFSYGLMYGLGFLAVGVMLSSEKGGLIGGVCAGLIGLFAVLVEASGGTFLAATSGAVLSVVLFFLVVANETGYIEWGGKTEYAKYATLMAFAVWFIWPLTYFYNRWLYSTPVTFETILYHGGIMLLAGLDLLTFIGAVKFKEYHTVRALFALMAVFGAVLLTTVLGWGLTLKPI
ncbi:MAG: hypothetical protein QXR76_03465 [Candidatus Bathyarchaeia archaeon]